jgi:hypothetical protein
LVKLKKKGRNNMEDVKRLIKNADKKLNRVIIPQAFIDKYGSTFVMEVYEDKIVLIPVEKGN